ncbi:Tripartite tricarboxylate transporter family receptor [Pigmentiphaga humi]|uniref:Tripartite tricarboxylate transporter family receptor n=1 Tax=Pigmentiphaga humi TaxID=2478468 RepID=A0A3P4B0I0_9BURK|nr:tripartite tricarboxylate transporter substrate binding protein [Pigmentiphaga humi]VCU69351.1 Tripartite tricarboxylate transporter family receptor [Pigmentiphaga humi]
MRYTTSCKVLLAASMAAGSAVQAADSQADDYPRHTVTLYVSTSPGGGPDILARALAEKLREKWGQPVVVENRPGGGQNVGAEAASRATPDGYTLLVSPQGALVANKSLYRKLAYDPDALEPVSILAKVPVVLVVNPKVPARSVPELIEYAKANPDRLNYASSGSGSTPHLTAELFKTKAGVQLIHVPYKSNPLAVTDLIGGQVDMMFLDLGAVLQHIRGGKLRALAVATDARSRDLPDVPTMNELIPGVSVAPWWGLVAPPKTPPAIVAKVSAAVDAALKEPEIVKRLADMGQLEGVGGTPEQAASFMTQERKLWGDLIRSAGITVD